MHKMYQFTDVNGPCHGTALSAEALCYNGVWIEDAIEGFRTLYTSGREQIERTIKDVESAVRDGNIYSHSRLEPRTITVGYQLTSRDADDFRQQYNNLLSILDVTQARVIFADEPDKYFVGTKTQVGEIDAGRLNVTGEIEIYCADPLKYSTKLYSTTTEDAVLLKVNYAGSHSAYPKMVVDVRAPLTGLQFGQFTGTKEAYIDIGDRQKTQDIDIAEYDRVKKYVADFSGLNAPSDWTYSGKKAVIDTYDDTWTEGAASSDAFTCKDGLLTRTDSGTTSEWEGIALTRSIAESDYGDGSAVWRVNPVLQFQSGKAGGMILALYKAGKEIVKIALKQAEFGAGSIILYIRTAETAQEKVILAEDINLEFDGSQEIVFAMYYDTNKLYGYVAVDEYEYKTELDVDYPKPDTATVVLMNHRDRSMCTNGLKNAEFVSYAGAKVSTDANCILQFYDRLELDCAAAEIRKNGVPAPYLGSITNGWEQFALVNGTNYFDVSYSDGMTRGRPDITVKYREAYL